MNLIEKIIYIADSIEEDRDFPGVEELRTLVYNKELDKALFTSFNNTINSLPRAGNIFLIACGRIIIFIVCA